MDISLIIPVHNLEHYIQPLLSSLYNQVIEDIKVEYIFILDNCTDNTKQVIEKWIPTINNANIHIYEVNFQKCGLARNYGVEHSAGKYIWFVDGDDMILSQRAIQILYNTISANDLQILRFGFLSIWYHLNPNAKQCDWIMVWQYIFKREFIKDIKFLDIQPHEDREFMKIIYEKLKHKIPTIKEPFYLYNYDRKGSNMVEYERNIRK